MLVVAEQLSTGYWASSLTLGSTSVVGKGPLGAMQLREEPQREPGRDREGNMGAHICARLRHGRGLHVDPTFPHSQQSPQGAVPPVCLAEQSNERRIPRLRLAGPVLLNLSSMILHFSRGGAMGPGPGAPALSSSNQAPHPRASGTSAAGLKLLNSAVEGGNDEGGKWEGGRR